MKLYIMMIKRQIVIALKEQKLCFGAGRPNEFVKKSPKL
jgi:hypothetical protein